MLFKFLGCCVSDLEFISRGGGGVGRGHEGEDGGKAGVEECSWV